MRCPYEQTIHGETGDMALSRMRRLHTFRNRLCGGIFLRMLLAWDVGLLETEG